ncbi:MAG: 16S rRNA (cytidine(1402)-2'-O)-methyltransferase [Alphaproteobacteria bacterium]|nr:16S rRNA (cytidine(1402)-2'-O)-methyltransferase [Alphaproteobacteria bacterium]
MAQGAKEGRRTAAGALAPGLYVVATPIGNARDITLRALDVLGGADAIACEDTRVTARLLGLHGMTGKGRLVPYHAHNEARETPRLLARLEAGAAVALVSDAGTPLLSDPGARLVAAARAAALTVHAVPGPSALTAALSVAGIAMERFHFAGFLPARGGARRRAVEELKDIPASLVLLEAPHRIAATLADLAAALGGAREAAVARELTKLHEEIVRGPLADLAERYAAAAPKGEIVLLVAPPAPSEPAGADRLDAALADALARASVKEAAHEVAAALGLPRREVYARALALKGARDGAS